MPRSQASDSFNKHRAVRIVIPSRFEGRYWLCINQLPGSVGEGDCGVTSTQYSREPPVGNRNATDLLGICPAMYSRVRRQILPGEGPRQPAIAPPDGVGAGRQGMQPYLSRRGVRGTINLSSVPPAAASAVVLRPFLGAWYCPAVCLLQRWPLNFNFGSLRFVVGFAFR